MLGTTQEKTDSTQTSQYYTDYSDELLLKFGTVVKSNKLEIINTNDKQSAKFAPAGITSLGGGVNYKWLGLSISFGLPSKPEDDEKYGKTQRFDAQLNIYSKKFGIDVIVQNYNGFYLENPEALTTWEEDYQPQLPRMQSLSVGAGGYYFFNNKKFSYKAAYVRNTIQNKSAGSLLLGGFYSLDYAGFEEGAYDEDTIVSFIPKTLPQEVSDSFDIKAFRSYTYGISFGYTYTLVFLKKCFINLSLAPGIGAKSLVVYNSQGENTTKSGVATRITVRSSFGYDNKHFIVGLTSYVRTANINFENYDIKPSTSNVRFFIAKRFSLKKKTAK